MYVVILTTRYWLKFASFEVYFPLCFIRFPFNFSVDCNEYSPCADEPCQHGGMCNSVDGRYICDCGVGYYGEHCERVNVCELHDPCSLHSQECRTSGSNDYMCICHEGIENQTRLRTLC